MNEVNADPVESSAEVIKPVQLAFLRPPVKPVGPVSEHLPQILNVGALLPRSRRRWIRPPRVADTRPQVRQDLLADPDRERLHRQT